MIARTLTLEAFLDADSPQATLQRIRWLTTLFDSAVNIPGTQWRIGLDSIIGLMPGMGDVITTGVSIYLVHQASRLGVQRQTLNRMIANVVIDFVGGSIPLVGDIFDAAWKCNVRNLRLLERDLQRQAFPNSRR